jgi:DNA-binding protein YbaB
MFDQLKDLYNLRKQAQELQSQLAGQRFTGSSKDSTIQIVMDGNHNLLDVIILPNAQMTPQNIKNGVLEAFNDAQNRLKSVLLDKFKGMA